MSALRFAVLAVVLAFGLGSAAKGSTASCPSATGSQRLYGNSTISCTAGVACQTAYCECIGGNRTSGLTCSGVNTSATGCAKGIACAATYIACANVASDPKKHNCTGLTDLWMSILAINGGKLYNASMAYTSCRYRTCMLVNASAGNNCTLNYEVLCPAPVSFKGTLLLQGNWSAILADPVKLESLAVAIEKDLFATLQIVGVFVRRLYTLGTSPLPPLRTRAPGRRQQRNDALIVEFEVPGVSSQNTGFSAKLTTVKANGNWLTSTKAEYTRLSGGQTLTFLGAAEGTGSGAFSKGKLDSLLPPTPAPPTPPTPAPPTPTTSGAAMQSVLAAVVVAVLSAMLF